ncbi:hypothetical protein ACFQZI_00015 [Mucilaginibacter lutimaris]|uniref:Uncharacterized protein n=1 Tax=Mucilaginibacter lutimaris TaxID=931629 RepID=A0ABW2Z9Q0_9SPHI
MAVLIQNKQGNFSLWSKNGTNDNAGMAGANNKGDQAGVGSFNSPGEFMKSDLNPIVNKKTGEREYTEGYQIPTTAKEDRAAEAGAKKELAKDYNVLGSNCACTVQSALESGGKKDGRPTFLESAKAVTAGGIILGPILGPIMGPVAGGIAGSKTPNLIYKRIKEQNENGKVIRP